MKPTPIRSTLTLALFVPIISPLLFTPAAFSVDKRLDNQDYSKLKNNQPMIVEKRKSFQGNITAGLQNALRNEAYYTGKKQNSPRFTQAVLSHSLFLSYCIIRSFNSTLLFSARPSTVLLSATGSDSPYPLADMRLAGTPLLFRYFSTASARA